MKTRSLSVALLLCTAVAAAQAPQPKAKPTATPPAAPSKEAEATRRAQALASYKGGQLTVGELEDTIAHQNSFMRKRYKDPAALEELFEKTLRTSLLSDEAARRGYDKNDLVQQSVKQNAVQLLLKADLDDAQGAASISKAEIEKYYQDHLDEYMQPQMQRASHVLLATEQEAKALLEQAKTMDLRAFRQLARDKSIEQATKLSGGDLRYFDEHGKSHGETSVAVPLPIVKAAFALKTIGDTAAKPVRIEAGYSIVKLTGQRPAISRKLAEVEEAIRVRLWRERRQQASDALVAKLHDEYKPETHPELVDAIKLEETALPGMPPMPVQAPVPVPK
jgi:hypothetical protein